MVQLGRIEEVASKSNVFQNILCYGSMSFLNHQQKRRDQFQNILCYGSIANI